MITVRLSRMETRYCISYSRSQEDPICNLLSSRSWQRTWTIHHTDIVFFLLQNSAPRTTIKDVKYERRHNILLWHFHHNKIRFVRRRITVAVLVERPVVSSSYRVDRKARISITISIPTRSGIHKLFRTLNVSHARARLPCNFFEPLISKCTFQETIYFP